MQETVKNFSFYGLGNLSMLSTSGHKWNIYIMQGKVEKVGLQKFRCFINMNRLIQQTYEYISFKNCYTHTYTIQSLYSLAYLDFHLIKRLYTSYYLFFVSLHFSRHWLKLLNSSVPKLYRPFLLLLLSYSFYNACPPIPVLLIPFLLNDQTLLISCLSGILSQISLL